MADRYWIGGSGTWDTTTTTNWSTISKNSGGVGGASVPTAADNVIFDQITGGTITMTGALACLSLTTTVGTFTFVNGTTPSLTVAGSITTNASTINMTGTITFTATTAQTINIPNTVASSLVFNGVGGSWTLQTGLTTSTTASVTLNNGTLALGSFYLTCGTFASASATARTINFGTGRIRVQSATTSTIWNTGTITNLTISGTPLVECLGGGTTVTKTINSGALAEASAISFIIGDNSSTVTYAFTAGNTVKNLTISGSAGIISNIAITIYGSYSYSGGSTFTAGTNAWTFAATSGSYSITPVAATTYDFPWTFGSAASTATWTLYTGLTLGSTRQVTLANGTFDINGNNINGGGVTILTGTVTLNNSGAAISFPIGITHTSGTLTLGANITTTAAAGYTFTAGTLSLGANTLTTPRFTSSVANVRTLNFGTGKIVLNGAVTDTIWNTIAGYTVAGTPLVECRGGGTGVTKTITSGVTTEANAISFSLLETSGTVSYSFSASNAVKNLIVNGSQTFLNTGQLTIYGSFTHSTTNGTTTFSAGVNAWVFNATSGSYTITPASSSFTYDFPWTFGSSASTATWSLQNVVTIGATRAITFTNGTLDANNYNFSGGVGITMITGTFTLNNTGGTVFLTSLPITHTSGTLNLGTTLTTTAAAGYTFTAGTLSLGSNILNTPIFSSNNANTRTLAFGTGKIVLNTAVASTIWNTATVTGLTVTGTPLVECKGGGTGVTKSINSGALTEANAISFSFLETTGTATYSILGNFKNIIVNGLQTIANTSFWIYGTFTHLTTNGTTTFTAGTNAWIFTATSGSYTIGNIAGFTYDFPWTFGNATSTAIWTLGANLTLGATKVLTLTNGTLDVNNKTVTVAGGITVLTGSATLNNTGGTLLSISGPITHTSGNLTLGTNLTTTAATGYTLTAGTLSLVTFTLTTPVFSSSNGNVRSLAFGTGQLALTGNNTTIFNMSLVGGNFSTTGTVYINCTYTGSVGTRSILANFTEAQAAAGYSVSTSDTTGIVLSPSATDTIALTAALYNVNLTGFIGTLTNTPLTVYGNWTTPSTGGTYTAGVNGLSFTTSSSQTITSNGRTLDFPISFNGSGTYTLQDNLTSGTTTQTVLTSGTLNLNGFTHSTGVFSSSGSTARTLAFGSAGQLVLAGSGQTIFNVTTATNFTTTGTPYINCTYTGSVGTRTIVTGFSEVQSSGYGVKTSNIFGFVLSPSATDIVALTGSFEDINLTGFTGTLSNTARTVYGNWTTPSTGGTYTAGTLATTFGSSSTRTITSNGRTLDFPINFAGISGTIQLQDNMTVGSTRLTTLAQGTLNLNNFILSTGTFNSSTPNTRTLAFGSTGQLLLTSSNATIFDITTSTNYSTTGTVYINSNYTGATGTRTFVTGFTEAQADGYSVATSGTSGIVVSPTATDIIALTGSFYTINLTGFTGTLSNTARTVYGSWTNPASGGTYTAGALATTFATTSSKTITTNGRSLGFPFTFNGAGGTWVLQTNFTVASTLTTTLTAGTLNLNNYILSTGLFSSSGAVARTIAYGTGQLALSGTGTVFDTTTATNFSSTGTVYVNAAATAGTKTIVTGFNESQAAGYNIAVAASSGISINSADVITLTGGFNNFNLTSFAGTLANTARTIYGNWTTPATGGTYTAGAVATTFGATSSKTITTNGRTLDFALTFDGVGGTWTVQDNLSIGATRVMTWNNGTLDLNNKTFSNPASITINGGATGSFRLSNTGGTQSYTIFVAVTHTTGELYLNFPLSFGAYTWNGGTITLNSYTLTVSQFTSTATTVRTFNFGTGSLSVGNSGACFNMLGATNHIITGTPNVYITNPTTVATSVVPGAVTEAQSLNFIFNSNGVAYTLTFLGTAGHTARNVDMGNFAGTWAAVAACTIYGSFSGQATGTITASANTITFGGTGLFGNKSISTNGISLAFPVNFNGVGSYWATGTVFNCDATHAMTFTNGTIDGSFLSYPGVTASSLTMTTGSFTMIYMWFGVSFTHTSGTLTISGTEFALKGATVALSTYTFSAGTLNVNCPMSIGAFISTTLVARTLSFGSLGIIYIQTLITPITSTAWNTAGSLGATTGFTTTGISSISINTIAGQTTTVAPGIMTEAQSLSFSFTGDGTLNFLNTASYTARDVNLYSFNGTWSATAACTIYGSMNLSGSMTLSESASIMTFGGAIANTTKTIDPAGLAIKFPMTFNSSVSKWTLFNALVMGVTAARALIITAGSFDTAYYLISAGFAGSTMSVNTGAVTLSNMNITIPFTLTSGTLTIDDPQGHGYGLINTNFTHTAGTLNLNVNLYVWDGNNVTSSYIYTFTAGALNLNGYWLQTCRFVATGATTRSIAFGATGQIIVWPFASTTGNVWDQTTIGTFSYTGTSDIQINLYSIPSPYSQVSTVVPGIATITNALNFTINSNNNNEIINILGVASNTVRNLNLTSTLNWSNAIAATCTVFGNVFISSGTTTTESANALTLGATTAIGTALIDFQGWYVKFPLIFNGIGGTFQLVSSFYMGATVARAITVTNGTLDMNGQSIFLGFAGSTMNTTTNTVSIINAHGGIYLPFTITSGTCTIRGTSDNSYPAYFTSTFTFTAGTMTLASNIEISLAFTYTAGSINLSTFALLLDTSYVASGATTRVITFGSGSYIEVRPTVASTAWNAATIGTFSYTGTSDIRITPSGVATTISTGAATEAQSMNFTFLGFVYTLNTTGCVFKNITLNAYNDGTPNIWNIGTVTIYGNYLETGCDGYGDRVFAPSASTSVITFTGTSGSKTINTRGVAIQQPVTFNATACTWQLNNDFYCTGTNGTATLTAGSLLLNGYSLIANIFNSSGAVTRTINFGTSTPGYGSAIIVKGNGTPFTTATVTGLTLSGTYPLVKVAPSAPSGTIIIAGGVATEAQSFSYYFYNGDNGGTYTLNFLGTAGYTAKDVDFSGGFTGVWAATSTGTIYGSLTLYGGTLTTSASAMTFGGTSGTKTIQTNSISIPFPITLNGAGSTFKLINGLTLSTTALVLTHTNGTLDLNGYTLTTGLYTTATGTKNITFNGGTLAIAGSGATAFNNAVPTGFTTTAGTGNGKISMSSATAKTFVGAGSTYNCALSQDGAGALTITGSNVFYSIANGVQPASILFTAGTTTTVTVWNVNGIAGSLVTISSVTAAVHTLSGAGIISSDYLSISYSVASGTGASWYAGTHSTNGGNNTGWVFTAPPSLLNTGAFFAFF